MTTNSEQTQNDWATLLNLYSTPPLGWKVTCFMTNFCERSPTCGAIVLRGITVYDWSLKSQTPKGMFTLCCCTLILLLVIAGYSWLYTCIHDTTIPESRFSENEGKLLILYFFFRIDKLRISTKPALWNGPRVPAGIMCHLLCVAHPSFKSSVSWWWCHLQETLEFLHFKWCFCCNSATTWQGRPHTVSGWEL